MSDLSRGPAIFGGLATGALLGLLLGLSASPVVSVVVGGLVTAAAAYWNLAPMPATEGAPRVQGLRALAAGVLCVGCIAGVLGGLWLRARDVFGVSPAQQVSRWTAAGYSPAEARAIAAYQSAGLVITTDGGSPDKPGSGAPRIAASGTDRVATTRSTVLFAGAAESCDQLRPDDYADITNLRAAFIQAGGRWRTIAETARTADDKTQMTMLRTVWQLVCER